MEKKVILEEMAMYEDLPQHDLADKALKTHFGEHSLGNPVIGTKQSITDVTSAQMCDYFGRRYAAGNVLAVAAGALDFNQFVDLISERCSQWDKVSAKRDLIPVEPSLAAQTFGKTTLTRQHLVLNKFLINSDSVLTRTALPPLSWPASSATTPAVDISGPWLIPPWPMWPVALTSHSMQPECS